jgi:outer membrane immunogenic protein
MTISLARSERRRFACAAFIAATLTIVPLSTFSAVAADLPAQPPAVAAPLWTGFYLGVHGGAGWANSTLVDPDYEITYQPLDTKSQGWLAGGQMGANWQFGSVVVGGEMDLSWSSVKGSSLPDPAFILSGVSVNYESLATGTGRVGYAFGNFLGYVKGGLAWANIDIKSAAFTAFPVDVNHQRTGLTGGVGLEWALTSNLSARLEYDYIDFGAQAIQLGTRRTPSSVDHELQLVKLGLNWRINGDYLLTR